MGIIVKNAFYHWRKTVWAFFLEKNTHLKTVSDFKQNLQNFGRRTSASLSKLHFIREDKQIEEFVLKEKNFLQKISDLGKKIADFIENFSAGLQNRILRVENNKFRNRFLKEIRIPGFWAVNIETFVRLMNVKTGF